LRILGAICCALVVIAVVAALASMVFSTSVRSRLLGGKVTKQMTRTCVACEGRGWVAVQERSLDFDGEKFAEPTQTSKPCERCGGAGLVGS
jgi:DnaJ-class molecular chaperone